MSDQEIVSKLERVWGSMAELCATFSEQEWKLATDCPKWSVQDHVAHIVGTESRLAGRPVPDHTPQEMEHVKNDIGKGNEVWVDFLRPRSGVEVLEAFREVTAARLQRLRGMSADDFSEPTQTPVGPGTIRDFMVIRIFDCWVHEQDVRRAVGRPGHLEGPVVVHSMDRMARAMPFVVGKKAAVLRRHDGRFRNHRSSRPHPVDRCRRRARHLPRHPAGQPERAPYHGRGNVYLPGKRPLGGEPGAGVQQGAHRRRPGARGGHRHTHEFHGVNGGCAIPM